MVSMSLYTDLDGFKGMADAQLPIFFYSTGTGAGTDQDHADFSTVEFWQVDIYKKSLNIALGPTEI